MRAIIKSGERCKRKKKIVIRLVYAYILKCIEQEEAFRDIFILSGYFTNQ